MEDREPIASLKFSKPAYVRLELEDKTIDVDVYKARRVLELADKQPTYEARWEYLETWLKKQFGIEEEGKRLAENILYEFNDLIASVIVKLNEERLGKLKGIPFLQSSIQVSPTTTENGV